MVEYSLYKIYKLCRSIDTRPPQWWNTASTKYTNYVNGILLKTRNLDQDEVDNIIMFVSDLRQVSGFLRVLQFPPPIKLKILLKVALNTIKQTL